MEFHSPVSKIRGFGLEERGISLYLKRDDLIHPFISGNKWRKLKYNLQEAKVTGKQHLITFGGAWSNHLLATACAGATYGFRTTGFVRGDEKVMNPVLSLCRLYGMELHYVDREQYRDKESLFNAYSGQNDDYYFIDEGGYSQQAITGCAEIISELPEQYEHICCACGTGTTLSGLSKGLHRLHGGTTPADRNINRSGQNTRLHGFPVLKNGEFLRDDILRLYPEANFELHTDYHFGGYAKTNPQLMEFVKEFCSKTGVMIEPVYTGKLLYGIFDLIRKDYFQQGDRILALHTGGLTGILGFYEQFVYHPPFH